MIDRFVARSQCERQKSDKLLFVPPPSIALDDIRANRFHRAPDLCSFFIHLKPGKFGKRHLVNIRSQHSGQLPDLQIAITHNAPLSPGTRSFVNYPPSDIQHPVSGILSSTHTKIVCSRPGPTEAMNSFAPVNSETAFKYERHRAGSCFHVRAWVVGVRQPGNSA